MNLILEASLSEPPTDALLFRNIIVFAHVDLNLTCLIETEPDMKDIYYKYLSNKHLMDFIDDIVITSDLIPGLRLGEINIKPVIAVKAIYPENYRRIASSLQSYLK